MQRLPLAACGIRPIGFVNDYVEDVPIHERMWWGVYHVGPLYTKYSGMYGQYFRPSWVREKKAYQRNLKERMRKLEETNAIGSKRHMWKRASMRNAYRDVVTDICAFINYVGDRKHLVVPPTAKTLCECLFKVKRHTLDTLWTFLGEASKRIGYLQELIEKNGALEGMRLSNAVLCVTTSDAYSLQDNEKEVISALFGKGVTDITWCIKTDERMNSELRVDYMYYEN